MKKTWLLWVIPMSTRIDKLNAIIEKDIARYGSCQKILIARYGDKESVFHLQSMLPILPKYIEHVHTVAGMPMAVNPIVQDEIIKRFKEIRRLYKNCVERHALVIRAKRVVYRDVYNPFAAIVQVALAQRGLGVEYPASS